MPRRLLYSRLAADDLAEIRLWHPQPGAGDAARRRLQAILAALANLPTTPCRYRRSDYPGTRRMTVEHHVVIYRVDPDTGDNETAGDVQVLRVFGPGQQQEL